MRKYLLGLFVLVLSAGSGYADTLSSLRESIRYKLQDSTSTVSVTRWSDIELNKRINTVQRDVAKNTRCLYVNEYSTPVAGIREYSKPLNCIAIDRVSVINVSSTTAANQYRKLPFLSIGGMDRDKIGWESYTAGLPMTYYTRGDNIGFDRPFSAVYCSTGAIKVDYYKYPADMSADSDQPFDSSVSLQVYSDVIILGVAYKCKQDELKWTEAQSVQNEYLFSLNAMIDSLYANTDNLVQKIKIGN